MTEKIDGITEAEVAKTSASVGRRAASWFSNGLVNRISHAGLNLTVNSWANRIYHGGIHLNFREGFVLRERDTASAAIGLLNPGYSRLTAEDVPTTRDALHKLLRFLIVTPFVRAACKDAATACEIALKPLSKLVAGDALQSHCDELFSLHEEHPELYLTFVLGDFASARAKIEAVKNGEERERVTIIGARQRILWGLWDIHRASTASRDVSRRLVPWFLRPLVRGRTTASAMLNAMLSLSDAADRMYAAQDTAQRRGRASTKLAGPKGLVLGPAITVASQIESTLSGSQQAELLSITADVRQRTQTLGERLRLMMADPERSQQQTIHQHHFGELDELAALFTVSYRFAEDERAMLAIIANPKHATALFNVTPRTWPLSSDSTLASRALHLLAAYREATLGIGTGRYDAEKIWDNRPAQVRAAGFMTELATASGITTGMQRAASMFDLSHQARLGSAAVG